MSPAGAPPCRRPRALAAGLAAVVLATACTGDDAGGDPGPASATDPPGPTATASAAASTTTTAPTTTAPTTTAPTTTAPTTTAPTTITPVTTTVPDALDPIDWPAVTGAGVTLVVIDRGVDWRHPDLRAPDGSTRIEAIVDHTGQQAGCAPDRPPPVVHGRAAIDAALAGGAELDHRDATGHGTASAGLAAGDGSASGGRYRGVAPGVDLVIVKLESEGLAPADGDPGEDPVAGCIDDALDIVDLVMASLDQPAVALWNTGTQWGPIDGTSAASRRIAESFGPDRPGRVWVAPAGDEGSQPSHASGEMAPGRPFEVPFTRPAAGRSNPTLWYSGAVPGRVTVELDDGTVAGPVDPGDVVSIPTASGGEISVVHYEPGLEFHPWTSTSGDRAAWIAIEGPAGSGTIRVEPSPGAAAGAAGRVDVYGDVLGPTPATTSIELTDHLVDARVTDNASTPGAIVASAHVARTAWTDRTGRRVDQSPAADLGDRWPGAAADPTRDGRAVIAVSAPGHHAIAPLAAGSAFSRLDDIVPLDGDDHYVVVSGTSAAAAIVAGAVALVLEVDPSLTADDVAALLRSTAVRDEATGDVPNAEWGHGKLDVGALVAAAGGS